MLIFGNSNNVIYLNGNIDMNHIVILNLSSMNEKFPGVALMPPPNTILSDNDSFDKVYFEYIMCNDNVFLEFMKIIMPLYYGYDVYIEVTQGGNFDYITESLIKIIQQRYGYNSYIVNEPEDILMIGTEIIPEGEFSIQGLSMLDIDKERYSYIMTEAELRDRGKI